MDKVRVLVADDHTVVRRGLCKILESALGIEVVGEVGSGVAAVAAAKSLCPDVILMDVSMPGINGIEATRLIATTAPSAKVLVLSMHGEEQYVQQSIAAGAKGYLLKDADDQDLVEAIKKISRGATYFRQTFAPAATGERGGRSPDALSPKEREVLCLIGAGLSNRRMAEQLGMSVRTVETHRKHLMEKLGLHSTAELVRYAVRHDLVS